MQAHWSSADMVASEADRENASGEHTNTAFRQPEGGANGDDNRANSPSSTRGGVTSPDDIMHHARAVLTLKCSTIYHVSSCSRLRACIVLISSPARSLLRPPCCSATRARAPNTSLGICLALLHVLGEAPHHSPQQGAGLAAHPAMKMCAPLLCIQSHTCSPASSTLCWT